MQVDYTLNETLARHNLKTMYRSHRIEILRCRIEDLEKEKKDWMGRIENIEKNGLKGLVRPDGWTVQDCLEFRRKKLDDIEEKLKETKKSLDCFLGKIRRNKEILYKGKSIEDVLMRYLFERNNMMTRSRILRELEWWEEVNSYERPGTSGICVSIL